jgi:hypothetical protein
MHKIAAEIGREKIGALGFASSREFESKKLEELLRIC